MGRYTDNIKRFEPAPKERRKENKNFVWHLKGRVDFPLLFVILILVLFGNVMVFSSSYYYCLTTSTISSMYFFLFRQLRWSAIGMVIMFLVMKLGDYHIVRRFSFIGYVGSCALLAMVQVMGVVTKGSARWLELIGVQFQPSEVAKI